MDPNYEKQTRGVSRRRFVTGASALGASSLLPLSPRASAEPPPETTKLRVFGGGGVAPCIAPIYAAQEELLRVEGFTDVRYVEYPADTEKWTPEVVLSGEADISLSFPPTDIMHIDKGSPLVILAGTHAGCVEVIGNKRVKSTLDLKGKTVGVFGLGIDDHIFISMFAKYVGLDPEKDINWTVHPYKDIPELFMQGKIDAFFTAPPTSLELRRKKIGHVLVSTTADKPWSQYVCCLVASTKDFVRKHPVATKRALRAILKGVDVCAADPERVARLMSDKGLSPYDDALELLRELPYGEWRQYDAEDALRFYALRMRDIRMIKSTPQQIIAEGTDWRFFNQLKKELKA